jgi:hypothetical protein
MHNAQIFLSLPFELMIEVIDEGGNFLSLSHSLQFLAQFPMQQRHSEAAAADVRKVNMHAIGRIIKSDL